MKRKIYYKGKSIYVKTYNNVQGSICFISTQIGFFGENCIDSSVTIWEKFGETPTDDAGERISNEIDRVIDIQKKTIDAMTETN